MYDAPSFSTLCKRTNFGRSAAYKLAAIARSARLAKYEDKLVAVHAWGVRYAIHALSDEHFAALRETYRLDDPNAPSPILTLSMVTAVRKPKTATATMRIYATIYVDEEAMKADLFTGDHVEALEDHLDEIRKTLPYTKVEKSGIEEKDISRYFAEVERVKKEILRKLLSKAIKSASARIAIHRRPGQKLNDLFTHCMCRSKEECWSEFEADPVAAIEYLGDDVPSLSEIHDQACSMVHAAQQKLADKVRAERREFKYANTATGLERISNRKPIDAADVPLHLRKGIQSDEQRNRWKAFGYEVAKAAVNSEGRIAGEDAEAEEFLRRCQEENDRNDV
ncbi:MAG: hypothetical protein ACXW06_07310 [Halobacteriota archaeon]